MSNKTCPAEFKFDDGGEGDSPAGTFEAMVSVFGVKDSYGEIVMPGAFTNTLAKWADKGDPIPVYWSHQLQDPRMCIGGVVDAKETDEGLWVKAQLNLDNPMAKTAHELLLAHLCTDFSFSYNVPPGGRKDAGDAVELSEIDLYEVGPTPVGANPETALLSVKAGRVLSAKNIETITAARDALKAADTALSELLKLSDEGKSEPTARVKTEEPSPAKAEDHAVSALDAALARIHLATL